MERDRSHTNVERDLQGLGEYPPGTTPSYSDDEEEIQALRQDIATHLKKALEAPLDSPTPELVISKEPIEKRYTESQWERIYQERMRKKTQASVERVFSESMKNPEFERHLFVADFQIPDQNSRAVDLLHKFIKDFAPDHLHIVGDFLNFTPFTSFDAKAGKQPPPIAEEIKQGRAELERLVRDVRKVNKDAKVTWYEGNHEERLFKYLVRQGTGQLLDLVDDDGEQILSIPYLFNLKKLGVEWVPAMADKKVHGARVEHGFMARAKAGYTAHGMLERRGTSGYSGHVHRQAIVWKTYAERQEFWVEIGSLCNTEKPTPAYTHHPDWMSGFAIGVYHKGTKQMYPSTIPIIKNSFLFGGKLYR